MYMPWWFKFFASKLVNRNTFLSSCLLLWKQLLILEVLPEAASEFQVTCVIVILSSLDINTGSALKRMVNINSAFEKADPP
jgi:hypothetical protein